MGDQIPQFLDLVEIRSQNRRQVGGVGKLRPVALEHSQQRRKIETVQGLNSPATHLPLLAIRQLAAYVGLPPVVAADLWKVLLKESLRFAGYGEVGILFLLVHGSDPSLRFRLHGLEELQNLLGHFSNFDYADALHP